MKQVIINSKVPKRRKKSDQTLLKEHSESLGTHKTHSCRFCETCDLESHFFEVAHLKATPLKQSMDKLDTFYHHMVNIAPCPQ